MRLHFLRWAAKDAPKIVLLHGMGGTGKLWRPVAISLEKDFDVLAFDQRGHGGSQNVPPSETGFTAMHLAKDVSESMNAESFQPAWIVGHSMGVRTACALAHISPDKVLGLILVDLGLGGPAGGGIGTVLANFLKELPDQFPDRAHAKKFLDNHCPDPAIAQYLMAAAVTTPTNPSVSFPFNRDFLLQIIHDSSLPENSVFSFVMEGAQRGLPILFLRGKNSQVWKSDDYEATKNKFSLFPNIQFEEIANAGHGLPFEQRVIFTNRVREFISKHPGSGQ